MPATLAKKTSSVSGKRTTRVKPAPDFKKLHQQFLQKLEQGKACTKKPCTVVEEFDLSKGGAKIHLAEIRTSAKTPTVHKKKTLSTSEQDKENCSPFSKFPGKNIQTAQDVEFQADKSALESILDNTGITMETLYPKPQQESRQTVCGNTMKTPLQPVMRRQTAATENIRRSIYYTGNNVKPSPSQIFSEYSRHVLSLSQRHTMSNANKDKNLGASPQLKDKVPYGASPLFQSKPMPRMSLFKRLPDQGTPTNSGTAKRLSPVRSTIKPKRVLAAKSPCPSSPSFKVPNTLPKSAKKPGIKWKDLLNEDMDRLQELEKLEKELETDIEKIEQKTPTSAQKTKKLKSASPLNTKSPLRSSKRNNASPRTPGQKNKSRIEALRNISPMRTPGQQASPKRLPPRSPLVGKQHQASPKRKAEPFPKMTRGADPSSTPPRNKRPVRENDITPKGDGRLRQLKSGESPLAKGLKGESPVRAILGELSPSVCRGSPKHFQFTEYDVEDKENFSPEMLQDAQLTRSDDSFFLVDEDDDENVAPQEEQDEEETVDELNRTLNQSIVQMENLEAQANKARRKTEDPDKLMEQLQLIQKKQKELMQMQMDIQEKLMKAQGKKSASKASSTIPSGALKATHAPTPSKRWRAQNSEDEELKQSENSVELSGSAYSEDSSENVTPLRKVLFPTNTQSHADTKEVHFQEEIEVCEITAMDVTALSSESSGTSVGDVSTGSSNVFESPVEVRIYGQKGEIDQAWKTQASISINNRPPIVSTAVLPTETPNKFSARMGSIQSFSSLKSVLPVLSPLRIEIPEEDCGYPRSDSLLDFAHSHNGINTHHTLTTTTTTMNSLTTPTKSSYCHSPRTPCTPSGKPHYSTSSSMSPCNITMSPLTISATEVSDTGSLSLTGNLSSCHSPMLKSRSLLDRCLLAQAQQRYEEALADDEVSRYMNRLSAMPRAQSPSYRCREPLSKILEEGDDKHFVPICKPIEEVSQESSFYPIVCPMPTGLPLA